MIITPLLILRPCLHLSRGVAQLAERCLSVGHPQSPRRSSLWVVAGEKETLQTIHRECTESLWGSLGGALVRAGRLLSCLYHRVRERNM